MKKTIVFALFHLSFIALLWGSFPLQAGWKHYPDGNNTWIGPVQKKLINVDPIPFSNYSTVLLVLPFV